MQCAYVQKECYLLISKYLQRLCPLYCILYCNFSQYIALIKLQLSGTTHPISSTSTRKNSSRLSVQAMKFYGNCWIPGDWREREVQGTSGRCGKEGWGLWNINRVLQIWTWVRRLGSSLFLKGAMVCRRAGNGQCNFQIMRLGRVNRVLGQWRDAGKGAPNQRGKLSLVTLW